MAVATTLSTSLQSKVSGHQGSGRMVGTFDGLEIRRSPVDMVNIPLFTGFFT